MSIRNRIWIFQMIAVAAVVMMAALTFFGVGTASDYFSRMQLSRQQLDAAMWLAIHANRFSEQIAELLLIGEPERADFESAREQTSAALAELRTISIREIDAVRDPAEKAEEQRELERFAQMQGLFREIDRAVERVLLLQQQGRKEEAVALFRSEIENRLDADFEKLIAAVVADERAEVAGVDLKARLLFQWLSRGALILVGLLVVIAIGSAFLFARSLKAPLKELADGALAVEHGDLDQKIAYSKRDELGLLARRFNAMVEQLRRQRQALVDAQAHLEREVSDRTRELGDANRELTELDRQRVKFLADVSHELKTPLTVLRGEAEVTLRGTSKPEAAYRTALDRIVTQATNMGRLVDDLLFLARTEVDDVRFDFRVVPLAKLVSETVHDISLLARDREMEISIDSTGNDPVIRGDPRRLKQAFLIVLDNAVKYANAEIRVGVGICVGNGHAQVSVRNDGPAIEPNELPHVFERFYRAANASPSGHSGSGLGLAIARWIIEKHDGHIDLSSGPGAGTEVCIQLPQMSRG